MSAKQREELFRKIYRKTQADYKATLGGDKLILACRGSKGTCLCSVEDFTDQELIERGE